MSESLRVLVTAVGGDLGQALVKALRLSRRTIECYGTDCDDTGIGSLIVDTFHVVPRADNPDYVDSLIKICREYGIQAVVPGSEPEIHVLSRLGDPPQLDENIPIICQPSKWFDIHRDKLQSMQQLSESVDLVSFADVNDPEALAGFIKESGFPAIVKPKTSSGSRSIQIVQNEGQLKTALERNDSSIIQEYIDDAGGEFSVGVFVCDEFSSAIAFKRDLGPVGCSWYAETSYDKDVLDYAMNVARASHLRGSANVQLRNSSKGPRLLEINPRFSSLVAARAICGFLDLEWSIDIEFGWKPEITSQPYKKIRFRRYFQEAVDFCDGFMSVPEWSVNR